MKNLRMKAARVGRDLSQEELAQLVGVTRQTIGMIEAGRFNPSLALCVAICRALGKTLNDLFWDEGEAPDEGATDGFSGGSRMLEFAERI
ncbi:MAG: helix-turn-helix transcriptional regulator [Clostridia bacterium]|nr:helix-turn-helix transcriptional regulator [Clostridia bacterium]